MERPGSNESCPGCRLEGGPAAGAATGLAAVLIFTIVVDVLGNALVILSVLRNKKLRNAVTGPRWNPVKNIKPFVEAVKPAMEQPEEEKNNPTEKTTEAWKKTEEDLPDGFKPTKQDPITDFSAL
ncbi:hypothetical protein TURU_102676 [Turdus rufiventris]|nr:hypothetical protein TURU_102676 [Turdus rufiventris]